MSGKLDDRELVKFMETISDRSIRVDALAQLLIEKGLITENELYWRLKEVQMEYESRREEKVE